MLIKLEQPWLPCQAFVFNYLGFRFFGHCFDGEFDVIEVYMFICMLLLYINSWIKINLALFYTSYASKAALKSNYKI